MTTPTFPRPSLRQIVCLFSTFLAFSTPNLLHAQSVSYAGSAAGLSLGRANVCASGTATPAPCSNTLTLTYSVASGTTIGGVGILTSGGADLDFKAKASDTSTTLCAAKTYASATSCTVDVTFAPLAVGQRKGAVQIVDGSDHVLATTFIYGTGVGPLITFARFSGGGSIPIGSGFSEPLGLTVDSNGNIYIVDNTDVKELLAVNGTVPANATINVVASNLRAPGGVAVDGAGNLFVTDTKDKVVKEILAVNGTIPADPATKTLITDFYANQGIAVDGSGNVYITEYSDSVADVKEILAVNGTIPTNPTINTLGSGFVSPNGVAVDSAGNVFVSDNLIKEILAVNGSIPTQPTINVLSVGGYGIALDAAGDIFTDGSTELVAVNGVVPVQPSVLYLGYVDDPSSIAVDGKGNVFVSSFFSGISEFDRADTLALSFASTYVGATSSDSPQIIEVQNGGNLALTGSGALSAPDFDQADIRTLFSPCTPAAISLDPGAGCTLSFSFTPLSPGSLDETFTFSDNSLNVSTATQILTLSGTALDNGLQFGTIPYGTTKTLSLPVTNTSGTIENITASSNGPSYVVTGSTCTAVAAGHSCALQVEFKPVRIGTHDDTLSLSPSAGVSPAVAPLMGVGSGVGIPNEAPLAFGTIPFGTTAVLSLQIRNFADFNQAAVSVKINGPSYTITSNTCTHVLHYDSYCMLQVQFSPASIGYHPDMLTVTPSDGSPVSTLALTGTASGVGALEIESPLQFGNIAFGTSEVLPLTIYNHGVSGTVTVGTRINGPSYKILTTAQNTCLAGVAAGQSCVLPIEFDPVSVGYKSDILTLTPTGGAAGSTVALIGTAH